METILVTGVAGFIGAHLARRLSEEGFQVIGIDDLSSGNQDMIPTSIEFIKLDLSGKKIESKLPNEVQKIVHLAGQSSGEISFDNPVIDLKKNTVSTLNLLNFARRVNIERFVYASSMSVYGDTPNLPVDENELCLPTSCYGVGKLASEGYLRLFSDEVPYVALRLFNVYGPNQDLDNLRQGMISIYLSQALKTKRVVVKGSLDRFRDFIYIDDVIDGILLAINEENAKNDIFNLGTGELTTVKEVLNILDDVFGNLEIISSDPTPGDQFGIYADISKIKTKLGFIPEISFESGLKSLINWAIKNENN